MKKRLLAILLTVALLLTLVPTAVLADDTVTDTDVYAYETLAAQLE